MVYLIVGLDRSTFARWHDNVMAADPATAEDIARTRAAANGIQLVVAAAIGPYSSIESDAASPAAQPLFPVPGREAA
jgi:hypothetical protein